MVSDFIKVLPEENYENLVSLFEQGLITKETMDQKLKEIEREK